MICLFSYFFSSVFFYLFFYLLIHFHYDFIFRREGISLQANTLYLYSILKNSKTCMFALLGEPCAWEKGILAAEGNQHSALVPDLVNQMVYISPIYNRIICKMNTRWWYHTVCNKKRMF